MFEKLSLFAFKNWKSTHFTGKVLTKLLTKLPQKHRTSFVGSYFSRRSHRGVVKLSMLNFEEIENSFLIFADKFLLATYSRKFLWRSFSTKQIWLFGKTFKAQKCYTKTLSKIYKILKNLFGFDHQAIEYTRITFEQVQSHKWNRHSLNIKLVCCVCGSSMN